MPRPKDCEFSDEVIKEALRRSDYRCECCGIPKEETFEGFLEIHHLLGIADAVKYYPSLAHTIISSLANARVLCKKCHREADRYSRENHAEMAARLQAVPTIQQSFMRQGARRL